MSVPAPHDAFGLYIHIPYCLSRCHYCDFNVHIAKTPPWERFFAALKQQWRHQMTSFCNHRKKRLASIYFGGGTPSLAPAAHIDAFLQTIAADRHNLNGIEITLEANPDTVSLPALQALRQAGVNRISLGWQSTHNSLLKTLGRRHTAATSLQAYQMCREAGFANINLDLIFALPGQTLSHLETDLAALCQHRPEHISLYALTYHKGTALERARRAKTIVQASEHLELAMMQTIDHHLARTGYEHYEVSNYAMAGQHARHNSLYWKGVPYLGLGPGAHSFFRENWLVGYRWENTRHPDAYMRAWHNSRAAFDTPLPSAGDPHIEWLETLTPNQLTNEFLMCGLRLKEGVNPQAEPIKSQLEGLLPLAAKASQRKWLKTSGDTWQATPLGMSFGDSLAQLMFLA